MAAKDPTKDKDYSGPTSGVSAPGAVGKAAREAAHKQWGGGGTAPTGESRGRANDMAPAEREPDKA